MTKTPQTARKRPATKQSATPSEIRFYRSNYLLVGRYTDDANVGPYLPLFAAAGEPAQLDQTAGKLGRFGIQHHGLAVQQGRLSASAHARRGVLRKRTARAQHQRCREGHRKLLLEIFHDDPIYPVTNIIRLGPMNLPPGQASA